MVQVNQCAEFNNTNCVLSYTSIGDPASNGSWQLSEYSPLHPLPLGRLVKAAALGGQSSIPSQTVWHPEPLDLKRLLLLLAPVVLADPAVAFDGGGFEAEEKIAVPTDQSKTKTLAKYLEFHQSCMDIQMTMLGEVAELMEDLATAHCYCEYTKLEGLETVTWSDRNDAEIACANEGIISKKDAFIRWALPLHHQRLGDERQ